MTCQLRLTYRDTGKVIPLLREPATSLFFEHSHADAQANCYPTQLKHSQSKHQYSLQRAIASTSVVANAAHLPPSLSHRPTAWSVRCHTIGRSRPFYLKVCIYEYHPPSEPSRLALFNLILCQYTVCASFRTLCPLTAENSFAMEQSNSTNNKQTPARRGRGGGRSRGRKTYASEGDALTDMPTPIGFPTTPMKSNNASPAPGSQLANPKSTTKKSNRKSRPNNVSTSPRPAKSSQRTPPQSASATVSTVAFASSSSFHSPAPGALPRPGFSKVTRSQVFSTSGGQTLVRARSESVVVQSAKEPSPPASDCESPSPPQPAGLAQNDSHDSPLEVLFQAQRAEQERLRRANSANAVAELNGPFSAPPDYRHLPNNGLDDKPIPLKLPSRPAQRGVSDNTGAAGRDARPAAFAMPIHERIQAVGPKGPYVKQPPKQAQSQVTQQAHHLATPPQLDPSEQMKMLLGISGATPTKSQPAPPQGHTHASPSAFANFVSPSNTQFSKVPGEGASPSGATDRKNHVENALRQALKLPWSISSGLDGNSSPQSQSGHYSGRFPG